MPIDLTNKSIIITGASSGIGRATAIACARAGMHIVLNARRADRLQAVAKDIEQIGRQAIICPGDVCDKSVNASIIDAAVQLPGGLYAVLANAGFSFAADLADTTSQQWREIFDVNVLAGVELFRLAAQHLIERGDGGHLIMTSSCAAYTAHPTSVAYASTKAAQGQLCASLGAELAEYGIFVSSVHPVTTTTEFFGVVRNRAGGDGTDHSPTADFGSLFVQPPERVAAAIVKALRRPRPQIWTSRFVRLIAAMTVLSPRFGQFVGARYLKAVRNKR